MTDPVNFISELLRAAGKITLEGFTKTHQIKEKDNQSNVVTESDLKSEKYLIGRIRATFPDDGIIAEESGYIENSDGSFWIIDPLDGTSNFVAGLPWFGVMIAHCSDWIPDIAGIYLPVLDELYIAQKGKGAFLNGSRVKISSETNLKNLLVGYQVDYIDDQVLRNTEMQRVMFLLRECRNLRSTNSCVDYCALAAGKYGACVSQCQKIWDIVPCYLLVTEAGGIYTNIDGSKIMFRVTRSDYANNYSTVAASSQIHAQLIKGLKFPLHKGGKI